MISSHLISKETQLQSILANQLDQNSVSNQIFDQLQINSALNLNENQQTLKGQTEKLFINSNFQVQPLNINQLLDQNALKLGKVPNEGQIQEQVLNNNHNAKMKINNKQNQNNQKQNIENTAQKLKYQDLLDASQGSSQAKDNIHEKSNKRIKKIEIKANQKKKVQKMKMTQEKQHKNKLSEKLIIINNNEQSSQKQDEDQQSSDNQQMIDTISSDSSNSTLSKESVAKKLEKIELKIKSQSISKKERRLLQNRKSALKCRLKKQDHLQKIKTQLEKLGYENKSLKEKICALNVLVQCKSEENENINKKYNDLQFQQTLLISCLLSLNGVNVSNIISKENDQNKRMSTVQSQLFNLLNDKYQNKPISTNSILEKIEKQLHQNLDQDKLNNQLQVNNRYFQNNNNFVNNHFKNNLIFESRQEKKDETSSFIQEVQKILHHQNNSQIEKVNKQYISNQMQTNQNMTVNKIKRANIGFSKSHENFQQKMSNFMNQQKQSPCLNNINKIIQIYVDKQEQLKLQERINSFLNQKQENHSNLNDQQNNQVSNCDYKPNEFNQSFQQHNQFIKNIDQNKQIMNQNSDFNYKNSPDLQNSQQQEYFQKLNENYKNRVFSLFKKNESNLYMSHLQLDDVDKILNYEEEGNSGNKYSQIDFQYNQSDEQPQ